MKLRILKNSNFTLVTHQLYLKSRNFNSKIYIDVLRTKHKKSQRLSAGEW